MKKFILLSLLLATTNVFAQFSGQGSGTEKDPYQVSNADELFEVRNDLTAYYVQTAEIDLTAFIAEDNPNLGWSPIGTEATPFKGYYNGRNYAIKGLFINRQSSNYVGLFGYTNGAELSSILLISPKISGKEYVGGIVGYGSCTMKNVTIMNPSIESNNVAGGLVGATRLSTYSDISGCVLINGHIKGTAYAGGISGISDRPYSTCNITQNYINANINGDICGGFVAKAESYCYYSSTIKQLYLKNNSFFGSINANSLAGGTIGRNENVNTGSSYIGVYINNNIVSGCLYSKSACGGIIADSYSNRSECSNNVAVLDTISGASAYRITNLNITSNNFASSSMVVMINGKPTVVDDNGYNGLSYGLKILKKQTTYEGIGFDFTNDWNIVEGVTLPYPNGMTNPCTITSFTAGSKATIEGTASGANKVYVFVNGNCYESFIIDGKWSVGNIGNIAVGTKAKVSVMSEGKQPSICVEATAKYGSADEDVDSGDANGDGTLDAADVVSIINYILGKPSSSFNEKNADVNEDGQILVDDAVETVNIIMNNQ